MGAIDVVRQHSQAERREVVVPEWGDMKLYFTKLTVADMKAVEGRDPADRHDRNLYLLITKAQGEDGKPLFAFGDKMVLETEAEFAVVNRVVAQMFETMYDSNIDKAQEDINANPPSGSDSSSASASAKASTS